MPNDIDWMAWRPALSLGAMALLLLWESVQPFFGFFVEGAHPWRARIVHAIRNVGLGVVNGLVIRFGFLTVWAYIMSWSSGHGVGVLHWVSMPTWARYVAAILLLDLWTYGWHRLNHTVPLFWRFHRLHHADRQMDVTTANRFHLGEIVLSSVFRIPVLAAIGCTVQELALYETLLFAGVQFHHANIGLPEPIDRAFRLVVVTPHLHKVHHSVVVAEQNANFSSLFSWWDRVAKTFRTAPDPSRIVFGVDER